MFRLFPLSRESLSNLAYITIFFTKEWLCCILVCDLFEQRETEPESWRLAPKVWELATLYKHTAIYNTNLDVETARTNAVCLRSVSCSPARCHPSTWEVSNAVSVVCVNVLSSVIFMYFQRGCCPVKLSISIFEACVRRNKQCNQWLVLLPAALAQSLLRKQPQITASLWTLFQCSHSN